MKNFSVTIDMSSIYGECHELEQAIIDLLGINPLLATREGTAIDAKVNNIEVVETPSDEDENDISGIKDDSVKIKRTTGYDQ
ncbi:MAG: hypothetical protein ACI35O_09070 [Bacillaceae bacterium]